MNRLELFAVLVVLSLSTIILIRSKRFDNFVSNLLRGTESGTASELKADIKQTEEKKKQLQKNLDNQEKQIKSERSTLEKL